MTDGAMSGNLLHRHQLAWLTPAGWDEACRREWDATAAQCLAHWAAQRLPLVVTRQHGEHEARDRIAMGLPAPGRWERRRLALSIARRHVLYFDEFPRAEAVERLLPRAARASWRSLCEALGRCGAAARVYGSYGWQHISGLDHLRADSDIDLSISVAGPSQADAVAARLQAFAGPRPRLDGELVFERDQAVAWREWSAWRCGSAKTLLVKHVAGVRLAHSPSVHDPRAHDPSGRDALAGAEATA